jgi:HEAT repeat protein
MLQWLGILTCVLLQGQPAPPDDGGRDGSLEAYLRRVRGERDTELARLRGRVELLLGRLAPNLTLRETAKIQAEIDALGPEAAPLFLEHLDPGEKPTPEKEFRAREVASALARSKNPAIQDELARLARSASPAGRLLALRVLGHAPDVARAQQELRALYPDLRGSLRAECVRSLARLDPGDPVLEAALADPQAEVIAAALRALTPLAQGAPLPAVLALLADQNRGADVLPELVGYLRACGQELEEPTALTLLAFAGRQDLPLEARLAVLDGLPSFGLSLSAKLRKEIEPLLESPDTALREGALIALARMKDSRAKRELLRYYDDLVEDNADWSQAYQRRADIRYRIGEFREASDDYRTALDLLGNGARQTVHRELWVNLARSQLKDEKLKAAAETLEEFGLSSDLKRDLAADPDFAPLREHPRYRRLFE